MPRVTVGIVVLIAFACAEGAALASPIQLFSRSQLSANDTIDWGQLDELANPYPSPLSVASSLGLPVLVDDSVGFNRLTEGVTWIGNFTMGDAVLFTSVDGTNSGTSAGVALTFATAVAAVGANIQANYYGSPFTATLQVFNGSIPLGVFTTTGVSTDAEDGSAPFLGAFDPDASITRAIFSVPLPPQNCDDLAFNCGLAINQVGLQVVPEPASWTLIGVGLAAVRFMKRRRRATPR